LIYFRNLHPMIVHFLLPLFVKLSLLFLLTLAFIRVFLVIITVQGYSMYPALLPGDRLLVLRHWPSKGLHKGQIVVGDLEKVVAALEKTPTRSISIRRENRIATSLENIQNPNLGVVATVNREDSNTPIDLIHFGQISSEVFEFAKTPPTKFIKRLVGLPGDTISIRISELDERLQVVLRAKHDNNGVLVWHIPPDHCFVRGDGPVSGDSIIWGPIPIKFLTGVMLLKLPSNQVAFGGNTGQ